MAKPNSKSELVTVRLEHEVLARLKEIGTELGKPWQTVMKALLSDALGIEATSRPESPAERNVYDAPHLRLSSKKLRRL